MIKKLEEINQNFITSEVNISTEISEEWEDVITLKGVPISINIIDKKSDYDFKILFNNKHNLSFLLPCKGIEIFEDETARDDLERCIGVYGWLQEGFFVLKLKGRYKQQKNINKKQFVFNNLIQSAKSCTECIQMKDKEAVIGSPNGNLNSKVMFIAEAPGPKGADITGIPLHGDRTGENFEHLLKSVGLSRADIFITNAVLCCPTKPNGTVRSPATEEIKKCSYYLNKQIELIEPDIIVPLGKKALESLKNVQNHNFSLKESIAKQQVWNNRILFPLYHPSPQVMNSGIRTIELQELDYKALKDLLNKLNDEDTNA